MAQSRGDFVSRKKLVASEFDRAHAILRAFVNIESDDQRPRRRGDELNILRPVRFAFEIKIDLPVLAVKLAQPILIEIEFFILQKAVRGDPGKHPMLAGFDNLAELFFRKRVRPRELDRDDLHLG